MKKLSVIIASLLFFAGMTIAQQNQKGSQPTVNKQGAASTGTPAPAGSTAVKKVPPPTKGKAVPATKATSTTPGATGK